MTPELSELLTEWIEPEGPILLMVFLLMLGYAVKVTDFIDNKFIPRINFAVGAAFGACDKARLEVERAGKSVLGAEVAFRGQQAGL